MAGAESYPEDLKYHSEHDWARIEGDEAVLGITWWAQDALGELVHFEAPAVGGLTVKDEPYGEVESVKAVSDVISPLSGEILEVNEKAVDEPESINDDPYGEGWLIRIRLSDPTEVNDLLDLGIGMGYVPAASAAPGSELVIDVRGRPKRAHVVKKPIYAKEES